MRRNTAPLVGLQQALCSHAAGTGGFYSRHPPVSSLQLGSYKHAVPPSRLAPTAGSLKGCLRGPLRHSFSGRPNRAAIRLWHHLTISAGKRSRGNFGVHRAGGPAVCTMCGGFAPPCLCFRSACASAWHRWAQICPSPGGHGEKHFFFRIAAILFGSMWGLPGPDPGFCGGYPPPRPGVHFWTPKSEPKNRQNQGFGFLCLNRSLSNLEHLCTELGFCHLIYSGSIDDASASGPVKGIDVSFVAYRNIFLVMHPREYPKEMRTSGGLAGESKGGVAPFVSSRGWGT